MTILYVHHSNAGDTYLMTVIPVKPLAKKIKVIISLGLRVIFILTARYIPPGSRAF